jgi:hypothetical protein
MLETINKMIQIYTKKHIFPPKNQIVFFLGLKYWQIKVCQNKITAIMLSWAM